MADRAIAPTSHSSVDKDVGLASALSFGVWVDDGGGNVRLASSGTAVAQWVSDGAGGTMLSRDMTLPPNRRWALIGTDKRLY